MTTFYNNYVRLCAGKGKSPSRVAEDIGLSRTSPHGWKKGKIPSDTTLVKLANYFDVSISDLTDDKKEKTASNADGIKNPAPIDENGEKILTNETLGIFLREMSSEDLAALAAQIALVIAERSTGNGKT